MMVIFWVFIPSGALGSPKTKLSRPEAAQSERKNKQYTVHGAKT